MQIPISTPSFLSTYGAVLVALGGFLLNAVAMYGAAQKLSGQISGQREEQRKADIALRGEQTASDQAWKKDHEAQNALRDVAIAALQAMGNSNEATVRGIQGQLTLIQIELQRLRDRATERGSRS